MKTSVSLITGGTGFIGSHLTRILSDRGFRVHVLSRSGRLGWRLHGLEGDVQSHSGDVTDRKAMTRLIRKVRPDHVFHLAANVNAERDPALHDLMTRVNVDGTENLLRACEGRIGRFIQIGTCEEYGNIRVPFRETDRENPVSPYSWSKVAATHLCLLWHRTRKFPVVVARPFLTYGPLQINSMFVPALIRACLLKKDFKMTKGLQTRELNYVSDIANGLADLATARGVEGEIVNIGSGREVRIRDVARLIHQLCNSGDRLKLGALPYRSGEAMRFFSSTVKARKLLAWRPQTPLELGLWATVDWYRHYLDQKK